MNTQSADLLIKFLESDGVKYPRIRAGNVDFQEYITSIYQQYIKEVKDHADALNALGLIVDDELPFLISQMGAINDALEAYLKGQPAKAYNFIAKWMDDNRNAYQILQPNYAQYEDQVVSLYRIREIKSEEIITEPKNMFHVPFEKRHKIKRYRFSIPGYPCLYAGSSVYASCQELNGVSLSNICAILLKPTEKNIKILDFGITPKRIAACIRNIVKDGNQHILQREQNCKDIKARILMWPMQVVSMLEVLYKEEPFVPEYIIPQLLLQYIQDDKYGNQVISGIRYYSTKCHIQNDNTRLGCNYVFPVKTIKKQGYCASLINLYHASDLINYAEYIKGKHWGTPRSSDSSEEITFEDNGISKTLPYLNTDMYTLEMWLNNLNNTVRPIS